MPNLTIEENVVLAPLTTIKLGGKARYFARCRTEGDVHEALTFAHDNQLPLHIMGGGSNTVFADAGFPGLVLQVGLTGRQYRATEQGTVEVTLAAGEVWDEFVAEAIAKNLAGVECLSGIPGFVGAAPMQNIGAYGQSVAETITSVTAIEVATKKNVTFASAECQFGYRRSRFKYQDAGRYVITAVTFALRPGGEPTLRYPELAQAVAAAEADAAPGTSVLKRVRATVIALRTRKSMVVRDNDPFSRSCGSFFMNAVVDADQLAGVTQRYRQHGGTAEVPAYPQGQRFKIPSAWLIEQAGFTKGERRGGVGISANHSLALVNYDGTTQELLAFAEEIESRIKEVFGIELIREPVVISA